MDIRKEKRTTESKIWINTIDFSPPLQFSKLYLMVEAKIVTLFLMFSIYVKEIVKTIINGGAQRDVKGSKVSTLHSN